MRRRIDSRAWTLCWPLVFTAMCALGCRSADPNPAPPTVESTAPKSNAPSNAAGTGGAAEAKPDGGAQAAQPKTDAAAPVAAVEDEFQQLLAGMGVRYLPAEKKL